MYEEGRFLLRERYRAHVDHVLDEVKFLGDQFTQDKYNKAFEESIKKLFSDLGFRESGQVKVAKNLAKDLVQVIIPFAFEHVRYIPISRIEVSDPMIDAVSNRVTYG